MSPPRDTPLFAALSAETRQLLYLYEEEAHKYGLARDVDAERKLEVAREDVLEALKSEFGRRAAA